MEGFIQVRMQQRYLFVILSIWGVVKVELI